MDRRRVVITGVGSVTSLGPDKETFWESLCNGRSGITLITMFDTSGYDSLIGSEVRDLDADRWVDGKSQRRLDRFCILGAVATGLAVEDAGLDFDREDPERVAVITGSGIGGLFEIEEQHTRLETKGPGKVSAFLIPKMMANALSGYLGIRYGAQGPNYAAVSACASGAHAIGDAFWMVRSGGAEVAITGGSEAGLTPLGLAGFDCMKALSTRNDAPQAASRPFDKNRDGFVLGEGAGGLILEELEHARQRGAHIYAELLGAGMTCDAYHITAPAPDGAGPARAMTAALKDGGVSPERIDYINAHGTSTLLNDAIETRAVRRAFGDHAEKLAMSSTKSMMGHLLGASGAVELNVCALAIDRGVLPPTINQETPDPECDLDYVPNVAREASVDCAMSNSLGFGGHNVSLVIGRFTG